MPVITVDDLKAHLNLTFHIESAEASGIEDDLLAGKIAAAQAAIESYVGAKLDGDAFPDGPPAPLIEAVRQFAAHLYENREPILIGATATVLPLNVFDLVGPYRTWVF